VPNRLPPTTETSVTATTPSSATPPITANASATPVSRPRDPPRPVTASAGIGYLRPYFAEIDSRSSNICWPGLPCLFISAIQAS